MKIDDTTFDIFRQLREGRKSFNAIADELDITENTVRNRVNKLKGEGIIDFKGLINPEEVPGHYVAFIGVKLNTMDFEKMGEELSKLKGVVSVFVVTGRFDILLQVLLKRGYGLLEFYTREVSKLEGVQSVETFVVYKGYQMKVPYVL